MVWWALLGASIALALAATPDLLDWSASLAVRSSVLPRLMDQLEGPVPSSERPVALLQAGLLDRLSDSDRQWLPRREPLPGGGTRFLYARRPGEPELTLGQIQALILDPPSYQREHQAIVSLLTTLQRVGVRLQVAETRKRGAAAEWDHSRRTLRIAPPALDQRSVDFARMLNHEAIHVAQSCAAGHLRARPRRLGPAAASDPSIEQQIRDPIYAGASAWEHDLEREAYAQQDQLGRGEALLRRHCRPL